MIFNDNSQSAAWTKQTDRGQGHVDMGGPGARGGNKNTVLLSRKPPSRRALPKSYKL